MKESDIRASLTTFIGRNQITSILQIIDTHVYHGCDVGSFVYHPLSKDYIYAARKSLEVFIQFVIDVLFICRFLKTQSGLTEHHLLFRYLRTIC